MKSEIYLGIIIIALLDYIIHGAITGMTLVMPLLAVIALAALEVTNNKPHNH